MQEEEPDDATLHIIPHPDLEEGTFRPKIVEVDGMHWKACWLECTPEGAVMIGPVVVQPMSVNDFETHREPKVDDTQQAPAAAPATSAAVPDPSVELLTKAVSMIEKMNDKTAWRQDVPTIRLSPAVLESELPADKGEGSCKRAYWPKALRIQKLIVPAFSEYLVKSKVQAEGTYGKHELGISRLFSMLEVKDGDTWAKIETAEAAADVKLLCGILHQKLHNDIIDLPILDPKYSWAETTFEAILLFCRWQIGNLQNSIVLGAEGPNDQYMAVLKQLVLNLETGVKKRLAIAKLLKVDKKYKDDTEAIKKLPSPAEFRKAVASSYRILKLIHDKFSQADGLMPQRVQGLANSCLAGALYVGAFAGRNGEWEKLDVAAVDRMLSEGKDWIPVDSHKTARTYGDLAKWLPEGLKHAFAAYRELPRPDGVNTFFVPSRDGTKKMSISSALKTFVVNFFPKAKSVPTVNLMRKYFHRGLRKITETEQLLKEVMVILDGHSKKTQDCDGCALPDPIGGESGVHRRCCASCDIPLRIQKQARFATAALGSGSRGGVLRSGLGMLLDTQRIATGRFERAAVDIGNSTDKIGGAAPVTDAGQTLQHARSRRRRRARESLGEGRAGRHRSVAASARAHGQGRLVRR